MNKMIGLIGVLLLAGNALAELDVEKLSPAGIPATTNAALFEPFLGDIPPVIVTELGEQTSNGVIVREVIFRSLLVGSETNLVYAIIASPEAPGTYPGVMWLHGGFGSADLNQAIYWAEQGYVAIAFDEPGIANPAACPNSSGPWTLQPYNSDRWFAEPDGRDSVLFDGVVSELQAFALLRSLSNVNSNQCGITGISWGGYSTTIVSGLLGDKVKAAYSIYGCGFYDEETVFQNSLNGMPEDERANWYRDLDAGRRVGGITAPFFIAAAVRDAYFFPPAVEATLNAMLGNKNLVFAPVKSHSLDGVAGEDQMAKLYFDYYLKGIGGALPVVSVVSDEARPDGSRLITFQIASDFPTTGGKLYYSASGPAWPDRGWVGVDAVSVVSNRYEAVMPPDADLQDVDWYVMGSDNRPATASTMLHRASAENLPGVSVPMSTFAKSGNDADYSVGGASDSGITLSFADDTDGRGDAGVRSGVAVLFNNVGDKLTYRATFDHILNSTNINSAFRTTFDFGDAACIHFINGYGTSTDGRINVNDNGIPFAQGTTVGDADLAFTASQALLTFSTGNTIDATFVLTLAGESGGSYDYTLDVTYASGSESSNLSRTLTGVAGNSIDGIYHLTNMKGLNIASDSYSVTNASLYFAAMTPNAVVLGTYAKIGSNADAAVSGPLFGGATLAYSAESDGRGDGGISATFNGSSGVTFAAVGDKLTYNFTYTSLVVTPNTSSPQFRTGFDFGTSAFVYHATSYGSSAALGFYANDNGNPFSSGSQVGGTVADWSPYALRAIRFDDGNVINGTVSLTLQTAHGDGTYDYLYEVTYINGAVSNSASQLFSNVAGANVVSINHLSNASAFDVAGDSWTVTGASAAFVPYTLPPTALVSWMDDYGITNLYIDTDNDGLKDLGEYAFGGNPTNSDSLGVQPILQDTDGLKYIYQVIADTNISHQVATQTNLVNGGGSINVTLDGSGLAADPAYNAYTNSVDTSVENAGFLQVEISKN
jgi:cephalosporin-C deacetylase-like acetyl esterase